jgi:DNA mismatch endonuclease, patch repair protein
LPSEQNKVADKVSPEQRSRNMSRVKGRDTKPEKVVRSLLHGMGYRFRLHRRDLPGRPDVVLPKHKKAVFIHGCFWHGHEGCPRAARPTTNADFWNKKIDSNIRRDAAAQQGLTTLGWKYLIVWQCQMRDLTALADRLNSFLTDPTQERKG